MLTAAMDLVFFGRIKKGFKRIKASDRSSCNLVSTGSVPSQAGDEGLYGSRKIAAEGGTGEQDARAGDSRSNRHSSSQEHTHTHTQHARSQQPNTLAGYLELSGPW